MLVNDPRTVVDDALDGLVAADPSLRRLGIYRVAYRADVDLIRDAHVTIISGGGSGHEPSHAGLVGQGMLTAAVAGDVFASPPPHAVLEAIRRVCGRSGTLLIVKNYTGDILNFGLALERARAEGRRVEMVVVGDDCALLGSGGRPGRRGLAGTALVQKIAGALSEKGHSLEDVHAVAAHVASSCFTMSVGLSECQLPGRPHVPSLKAGEEMEMGLGIHGEKGAARLPLRPADETVDLMWASLLGDTNPAFRETFRLPCPGEPAILLVNNVGGTSQLEMGVVLRAVLRSAAARGIVVRRIISGALMTSISMAGVSLTLLPLRDAPSSACPLLREGFEALALTLADAHTGVRAWPGAFVPAAQPSGDNKERASVPAASPLPSAPSQLSGDAALLDKAIRAAANALIRSEAHITELDAVVGDGDCGETLRRGAEAVLHALSAPSPARSALLASLGLPESFSIPLSQCGGALLALSDIIQRAMGGSSGAFYSIGLAAAAASLGQREAQGSLDLADWSAALKAGISAMRRYGGASAGDRTMLDALIPASEALEQMCAQGTAPSVREGAATAAKAADTGAQATASMDPHAGRSSYVDAARLRGTADPGAVGVAAWMQAVADVLAE
eukprot:Opistho-1_new@63106